MIALLDEIIEDYAERHKEAERLLNYHQENVHVYTAQSTLLSKELEKLKAVKKMIDDWKRPSVYDMT